MFVLKLFLLVRWCQYCVIMMFSMNISISRLFTVHVLCHDKKKYVFLHTFYTLLDFFLQKEASNEWCIFRFFSYLIIFFFYILCIHLPLQRQWYFISRKLLILNDVQNAQSINIVCGVVNTFSNLHSILICIYFYRWDW